MPSYHRHRSSSYAGGYKLAQSLASTDSREGVFATVARSHPVALTKWLQAYPSTLRVPAKHLVAADSTAAGASHGYRIAVYNRHAQRTWQAVQRGFTQLVSAEQWLRVLQCMKNAPQITELHVWGRSLHKKRPQNAGNEISEEALLQQWPNAGSDECNVRLDAVSRTVLYARLMSHQESINKCCSLTLDKGLGVLIMRRFGAVQNFFEGLARGHDLDSLPVRKLVIDDILLVPSRGSIGWLPVIESAFSTLSGACRLTDLELRDMWCTMSGILAMLSAAAQVSMHQRWTPLMRPRSA